jgi:hypothetical protein
MSTAQTRTRAQQGRSNNTKGKAWMTDAARYLRDRGFPGVDVISDNGRADLSGLTEWAVECKNMIEDRWPEVMRQVQRDQAARGARWHVILKKSYKQPPGQGLAVMTIEQWAEIAQLLDRMGE